MSDNSSESNLELLSVSQVALELGVSRQRIHELIKNGQIVARKLARFYYIEKVEMQRYREKPMGKPYQPRTTSSLSNSVDQ